MDNQMTMSVLAMSRGEYGRRRKNSPHGLNGSLKEWLPSSNRAFTNESAGTNPICWKPCCASNNGIARAAFALLKACPAYAAILRIRYGDLVVLHVLWNMLRKA